MHWNHAPARISRTRRAGAAPHFLLLMLTAVLVAVPLVPTGVSAAAPGNQYFARTWERTDKPVSDLTVGRTWIWGPEAFTDLMTEPYQESPGRERSVQYYDKSRMEITNPNGDTNSIWFVTNGLLVVELITGKLQLGDSLFEERLPAEVNVAGDANDPDGPQYATFGSLLDVPPAPVGELITKRVSRDGQVTDDPALAAYDARVGYIDTVTNHAIAAPFWGFMNSSGIVHENGQNYEALLFENAFFGTGRPITEAYWATMLVAGTPHEVLMQCFERRCLTYTPDNPEGWRVEAGNVGQHYYAWRYPAEDPPGNEPPGNEPPGEDPPGQEPPPGDPPGEDPPGDPPPGDPPVDDLLIAPANLAATPGIDDDGYARILLEWEDRSDDEWDFAVYLLDQAGNPNIRAAVGQNTTYYSDRQGAPGEERCYVVAARRDGERSELSNTACAIFPEAFELEPPELLSPVDYYVSTDRRVEFTWALVEGAATYRACVALPGDSCADNPAATWQSSPLGPTIDTTVLEIPYWLAADGEYTGLYWTVAACDEAGVCIWQPHTRAFSLDLTAIDVPAPPTNLVATPDQSSPGVMDLTWQDNAGNETGFRLYWYPDANPALVAALGANVESHRDETGAPSQQRCYYVIAYNDYGNSAPSNVACAITAEQTGIVNTLEYPRVYQWHLLEHWYRARYVGPTGPVWEYHMDGTTYEVHADGSKTQVHGPADSLNYPLLIEQDGTVWEMTLTLDRVTAYFWRRNTAGSAQVTLNDLPPAALANVPAEYQ